MHSWKHWVLVVPLLLGASATQAAPKDARARRDVQERAAQKACLTGDTAKGVEILADLFIATKNPTYIYNQGRCFEQARRYDDAIGRFREYLIKATDASDQEKIETQKHIEACQSYLRSESEPTPGNAGPKRIQPSISETGPSDAPTPSGPAEPSRPPAISTIPPPSPASPLVDHRSPGQLEHPGRALRIAGVTTGVVGVLACGTGVAFGLRAKSKDDQSASSSVFDPQLKKDADSARTMAYVFFAVGGAAVVTGTILAVLGWSSEGNSHPETAANKGSPSVALARPIALQPILAPNAAGLVLGGAF
jgi:hypothetical protein